MSPATVPKSSLILGCIFLLCVVVVGTLPNGRSLQAGSLTPTSANFLPLVARDATPEPPLTATNTPNP